MICLRGYPCAGWGVTTSVLRYPLGRNIGPQTGVPRRKDLGPESRKGLSTWLGYPSPFPGEQTDWKHYLPHLSAADGKKAILPILSMLTIYEKLDRSRWDKQWWNVWRFNVCVPIFEFFRNTQSCQYCIIAVAVSTTSVALVAVTFTVRQLPTLHYFQFSSSLPSTDAHKCNIRKSRGILMRITWKKVTRFFELVDF